jgi:ribosomal protein S18 acetylase RimI-like enzyme
LITIRDAREDEIAAVRDLTMTAYEQYSTIMEPSAWEGLKGAIQSGLATTLPAERIVAEQDGVIVGAVMLFPAAVAAYGTGSEIASVPEVRALAVSSTARGQGVGRMLVEECIARSKRAGAAELGLHTSKSMVAAIHLYEQMGFVRYPADDFQPEGTELITAYRLRLDA